MRKDDERGWPSWLVARLGPDGPELGCDECFALLDRYVELELDGVDAASTMPRLARHLQGCPVCREEHDDLLALLRADAS